MTFRERTNGRIFFSINIYRRFTTTYRVDVYCAFNYRSLVYIFDFVILPFRIATIQARRIPKYPNFVELKSSSLRNCALRWSCSLIGELKFRNREWGRLIVTKRYRLAKEFSLCVHFVSSSINVN